MHRANVILFGAGLLLAASAPAFAQAEGEGTETTTTDTTSTDATATDATATDATATGDAAATGTTDASATATADGDTMGAWPQAIIDRPYVREKGKLTAYGDLDIQKVGFSAGGVSVSVTGEALHVGAAYSVAPKLAVGVDYLAGLAGDLYTDNTGKGPLAIFVNYALADSAKMHIAVNADFVANLASDPVTKAINVGLGARYNVAPKVAVFTGAPFGPGPVGQHLTISLEEGNVMTFDLPVGVGLQATPQLFAYVQPVLASILVKKPEGYMGDTAAFYFSDNLGAPTNIGAWFAVNKNIDAGLNIFDDLKHAGDFYTISLGARWYN